MAIKGENRLFDCIRCADSAEWLEMRRKGVGGSDVAALVGLSPWSGPSELYLDKTGNPLPDTLTGSGPVEFGNDFEQHVVDKFAETHPDLTVRRVNALLRSKDRPWAQASLDGEVRENGEWGVLEIKCPGSVAKWNEGIPAHYVAQVQHYMHVTGRNFAWVCAFFRDTCEYDWRRVERDDELIERLEKAADEFWLEHVLKGVPPTQAFGTPDEASALARLHTTSTGMMIHAEDDTDLENLVEQWLEAKRDEAAAKDRKTLFANQIMQVIGDDKGLIFDDARVTWTRGTSSYLDKRKLELLYPGAIAECSEERPKNMGLRYTKTNRAKKRK